MTVYIVIDFRKYGKLQVLFALLCCLTTIYLYPLIIPIPVLPQILMTVVNAYVISKIFELDFKFCLKRLIILCFGIVLIMEAIYYFVVCNYFNVNFYMSSDIISRFIITLPFRLVEFILIYCYKKVSDKLCLKCGSSVK